uniref:Uncharacterized protein n=1 Tax=Anguilla anguilla TaxID=7936 RepID=A0A0E9PMJ3_ANGAN
MNNIFCLSHTARHQASLLTPARGFSLTTLNPSKTKPSSRWHPTTNQRMRMSHAELRTLSETLSQA